MKNKTTLFRCWLFTSAFTLCFFLSTDAQKQSLQAVQESQKLRSILLPESKKGWHRFAEGIKIDLNNPDQFFKQHAEAFELLNGCGMTLTRHTREDALQMDHFRFQQTYNGIPILGAEYILHHRKSDGGSQLKGNGNIVRGFSNSTTPAISADAALKIALAKVDAKQYAWESPDHQAMARNMKKDDKATLYPQPKLVYYSISDNQSDPSSYQLAYELNVFALEPLSHTKFYVSAETGAVIQSINLIHENNTPATGTTLYNGVQNIITDFTGSLYVLKETNRAGSGTAISTYDMNYGTNYGSAVNYQNSSTAWQNEAVGVQGHWGMEKSFDYFYAVHGQNSFDNNGSEIIGYMDYDVNYNNAFWNGLYLTFGSGNAVNYTSWSSLDIVGHEFTHAVTEYSAGLVYLNESGALNESFSDIFGNMVEFSVEGNNSDWHVSEDITPSGSGIRSMSNPNVFNHPDTYHGTHWYFLSGDFGGVHINSGVQNHWFYLLSQGGSGTNDNGDSYSVTGVGREMAAAIAYRNLTLYLTSVSKYLDAREGALEAAEDLYGRTSATYAEIAMAWHAVGVGYPVYSGEDVALRSVSVTGGSCNQLTVELVNLSTSATILSGAMIEVLVMENGAPKPVEQIVLASALAPGNSTIIQLTQGILSTASRININAQINYVPDPEPGNNIAATGVFRGILTIGGINPDFTTVSEAADALADPNIIICGHLNFRIRNGQYNGEVRLINITASALEHTITFESESGNPDDVTIYSQIPFNSAYGTITIANSNYIRIRNLTVIRESSPSVSGSVGVALREKLTNIILEGNKFKNPGIGSYRTNLEFWPLGRVQNQITIRNNNFEQANHGIANGSVEPAYAALTENVFIENNRFADHQGAIKNLQGSISLTIRSNIISSSNIDIISIGTGASQLLIEGNDIRVSSSSTSAVYMVYIFSNPLSTVRIVNNMISIKSSTTSFGLVLNDIARSEILHNTIRQEKTTPGSATSTSITFSSYPTDKIVLNNILHNSFAGGRGINLSSGGKNEINHNNFHIPNGSVGRFNMVLFTSLPQWQTATSFDLNSVAVQPTFISDVDLHLTTQQLTLKHGKVTAVQSDFDGQQRSAPPYMGADEYFFSPDVGVVAIRLTSPAAICQGTHVQIDIQNFLAVNAFPSGTRIPVSFKVNNGVPMRDTLILQQDLHPGQIATHTFTHLSYFEGSSTLAARTNYPGDQDSSNDEFTISISFSSVFSIGENNSDFVTLQDAIDFISSGQAVFCEQIIILDMSPGNYTRPTTLKDPSAAHPGLSIIIQSQTRNKADVILASDNASTISLNGAKHIVFRDLTIQYNGKSADEAAISLENNCGDITIENCDLRISSPGDSYYLIKTKSSPKKSQLTVFRVLNNLFDKGGINLVDELSNESGSNEIEIKGNTFQEFYSDAVVVQNASNLQILDNNISSKNSSGGIRILQATDNINIEQNRISLSNGKGGINIDAGKFSSALITLTNNFIDLNCGADQTSGISVSGASGSILHNTVRLAPGSQPSPSGVIVFGNYASSLYVRSNIFHSTITDATGIAISQTGKASQDFNDIYIPNGNVGIDMDNRFEIHKTLDSWRKHTGFDLNSTDVQPVFTDKNDLHLAFDQPLLRPEGIPKPYIEIDIDGEQRAFPPCTGADEFTGKQVTLKQNTGDVTVYPNPVEEENIVLYGNVAVGLYGISIYDIYGVLHYKEQLMLENRELSAEVRVNDLSRGIYLLRLTNSSGETWIVRFEKK